MAATYPSQAGITAAASANCLATAAQRQQQESHTSAAVLQGLNYAVDVPINTADLERWGALLRQVAPPPPAVNARFSGGGFLSADAVLSLSSEEQRREAVHKLAPFPPFQASAVVHLPMTKALKLRREWLPHRQRFPVYQQRMPFLDALINHPVVALVGGPGTGRTLQVPTLLSENEAYKRRRIVLVSATDAAARLAVFRLREERGEDPATSHSVAAVLPALREATAGTSVVVTTADMLLRQLLCDPTLMDVGCVIFDDVHLRTEATELCLAMLRDAMQQHATRERTASAAPESAGGTAAGSGAAGRRLNVVLNCPDDACATPLLEFFSGVRSTIFNPLSSGAASAASVVPPVVLYVEEVVQWLYKCAKEGSCLCTDVDTDLAPYVENVDVVTKVMAAAEADFSNATQCRQYWCDLAVRSISHYDAADRAARVAAAAGDAAPTPLPAIVVIAPSAYSVELFTSTLEAALLPSSNLDTEHNEENADGSKDASAPYVFTVLREFGQAVEELVSVARRTVVTDASRQRWVLLMTPELAQTVLPSSLEVGLVVDCARQTYRTVDFTTMADGYLTEYASINVLKHRRSVARLSARASSVAGSGGCMVIQLIPKSVLHSAQHRRLNTDPTQHIVFRLPFERYVQLYQILQAREEAAASLQQDFSNGDGNSGSRPGSSAPSTSTTVASVAAKAGALVSSQLIGVPAGSATRYEHVRRVFYVVESFLQAAGQLQLRAGSSPQLRPLGVLAICLGLPTPVARLLVTATLLDCVVEATAMAALWLVGDPFAVSSGRLDSHIGGTEAAAEALEEKHALLKEARLFFSRESTSDIVSAFNVYKMWLGMRETDREEEEAFLAECGVPRALLESVERTQKGLYRLLVQQKLLLPPPSATGRDGGKSAAIDVDADDGAALSRAVVALPEEAALQGRMQACLTAALYPRCLVPQADGSCLLLDGVHVSSSGGGPGSASAAGGAAGAGLNAAAMTTAKRFGVCAQDSVLSMEDVYAKCAGKPFLYLDKALAANRVASATGASVQVAVLEQASPLHEAASVLFCGQGYERLKPVPVRCRGWSSVLTNAWRQTKRARQLPPPSQLPTVAVEVQPYDTVRAAQVIFSTDHNFSFTMRATTSQWLAQLREHSRRHLVALAGEKAWQPTASAAEFRDAWEWFTRRQQGGTAWLREERASRAAAGEGFGPTKDSAAPKLYPYFVYTNQPGIPEVQEAPANQTTSTPAAAAASSVPLAMTGDGGGEDGEAGVVVAETGDGAGDGAGQSNVYNGKVPSADVDHIFRMCVKSVASKRTREAEAQLLRDNPDLFSFLDPENEFHEYYLFLLRQAAPDMEILGDNLEELVDFLRKLEDTVRAQHGLPTLAEEQAAAAAAAAAALAQAAPILPQSGDYQLQEVAPNAGDGEEASFFSSGLQVETAAYSLKRSTGPSLNLQQQQQVPGPQPATTTNSDHAGAGNNDRRPPPKRPVDPNASIGSFTFASSPTSGTAGSPIGTAAAPPSGGGGTLMEKLMAMQGKSATTGSDADQGSAASMAPAAYKPNAYLRPPQADEHAAQQAESGAGQPTASPVPPPTREDLLAMLNLPGGLPALGSSAAPMPSGDPTVMAPTAAELLALLGAPLSVDQPTPSPAPAMPAPAAADTVDPSAADDVEGQAGSGRESAPPAEGSAAATAASAAPPAKENPLKRRPPPIPAKAIEERAPSVVVYPLPDRRQGNVPALLAKALGDVLSLDVGPTQVVGKVARINVPNRKVEARALAIKSFPCAGKKVFIFRNDRIIDNPDAISAAAMLQIVMQGAAPGRFTPQPPMAELYGGGPSILAPPPMVPMMTGGGDPNGGSVAPGYYDYPQNPMMGSVFPPPPMAMMGGGGMPMYDGRGPYPGGDHGAGNYFAGAPGMPSQYPSPPQQQQPHQYGRPYGSTSPAAPPEASRPRYPVPPPSATSSTPGRGKYTEHGRDAIPLSQHQLLQQQRQPPHGGEDDKREGQRRSEDYDPTTPDARRRQQGPPRPSDRPDRQQQGRPDAVVAGGAPAGRRGEPEGRRGRGGYDGGMAAALQGHQLGVMTESDDDGSSSASSRSHSGRE